MRRSWLLIALSWLCLWSAALRAQAPAPATPERVYLATMAPGTEFWSVFGHNALVLEYADQPAQSYNFGYFDFEEPGFLRRFAFGAMEYLAVALPAEQDLGHYIADGRAVLLQELDLDEAQRALLLAHLRDQVSEQNRRYRYDYFRNNCSTKVRDALDAATAGAVSKSTSRRSHGYSWRGLALAQSRDVWWMYLAMHAGLGQVADQTLSITQESYIPALLMEAVRSVQLPDGERGSRPLVRSERTLSAQLPMPPSYTLVPVRWYWFLLAGLTWAVLLTVVPRAVAVAAAWGSALLLGLAGATCVFFWVFTAHWAAAWNQNLVLFDPLYLVLVVLWSVPASRRSVLPLSFALLVVGALGSFAKVLPAFDQQNIEWVLLLLPVQWGIWRVAFRRASPAAIRSSSSKVA